MSNNKEEVTSTVARLDDGTVQITFTIPWGVVLQSQEEVVRDYEKITQIPGFRSGKAPKDKVKQKIPSDTLIEKSLAKILPEALSKSFLKNKIKPAIYPKFEVLSNKEDENWQIRATTCELPLFTLCNYKEKIISECKPSKMWTPDNISDNKEEKKELSNEEKEQEIIKCLPKIVDISIPKLLLDEEINLRLSSLLEKLEKLNLNLDSYLASIGKDAISLRKDYENQAKNSILIELILNKIVEEEKIEVNLNEINDLKDKAIESKAVSDTQDKKELELRIRHLLLRKKALGFLITLI